MVFSVKQILVIFNQCIQDYHVKDDIHQPIINPFSSTSFDALLYNKNWIDTVQWHFEDLIREPSIDPVEALKLKRQIDDYNQRRTNMVEQIEEFFYEHYKNIPLKDSFKLNTETLGWAIDRLSILCLKIYHMKVEVQRKDAEETHKKKCENKLFILLQQQQDLTLAIEQLQTAIQNGEIKILQYKQMKMYNDPSTNPVLYGNQK